MIDYKCEKCGEVFLTLDSQYIQEYPNSSDLAIEQARLSHDAHVCPFAADNDVIDTCPDCGQVIWGGNIEYVTNYPNGSNMTRERASIAHWSECPVAQEAAWKEWREKTGAMPGETPRQLLERLRLRGWTKVRLLSLATPPDRYINGEDWGWEEEIYYWWTKVGPLVGLEHARAKANGYV